MNTTYQRRILLADNSEDYRRSLKGLLELENYVVEIATSVEEVKQLLATGDFDLILVDLRLTNDSDPYDISGYEVAKLAQKLSIPCIFVSGFTTIEYQRIALRSREDEPLALDFIEKQQGPQAVLDDLKILFTRRPDAPILQSPPDLSIDLEQGLIRIKGEILDLTKYQYAMLACLYQKRGGVATQQELLKAVYEGEPAASVNGERRLERLIDRLREKIEEDPSNPRFLLTVYGRGYRLALDS